MGVSAVPGSGKTWTLSSLAAKIVAEGALRDEQEVLIVTLVNSAVDNFAGRVAGFLRTYGLLPGIGYRVRTLHGLAHDIVRERPGLVGLSDEFTIVDDRVSAEIMRDAALAWLRSHTDLEDAYLASELDEDQLGRVRANQWPDLVVGVATAITRQAKDLQVTPAVLRYRLDAFPQRLLLLEMGCAVYADYQRALAYRGAVDFDDLIRLALQALRLDPAFLERLRQRWPYVLEDEAQDSSHLQEVILRELVGPHGNWVRVGDPNQAIYETFTTANPRYLREFLDAPDVLALDLPNSGRSMQSVIDLANALITWTTEEHPVQGLRSALGEPYIEPAPRGDPQPNPPDDPDQIRFVKRGLAPRAEIEALVRSAGSWVREHPEQTAAILVPRNVRGFEIADALRVAAVPSVELLRSTPTTREAAGALANVVRYLADPASARKLAIVYRVWRRDDRHDIAKAEELGAISKLIALCPYVEDFIWPRAGQDWLEALPSDASWAPALQVHLGGFRELIRRWQGATLLPVDQLMLTLGQDLFTEPPDLAIAHKLALALRQAADDHPDWRLPELAEELATIARNERRFIGFAEADTGFDPESYKGQVVITTMHKSKGLEWDKVYLVSVNDYDFPSALPQDRFISEPWFVRDQLNLQAEALAQLEALELNPDLFDYDEGSPTLAARRDYAAERLRLFYVGITRARRAVTVTWNTGRQGTAQPAAPLLALQTWWEEQHG
ncbi:MAG: ATP-dependent helicase [Anaerolineae bacterium]|nr:ATP-dependent helicase [Anaerolineae bacterium]